MSIQTLHQTLAASCLSDYYGSPAARAGELFRSALEQPKSGVLWMGVVVHGQRLCGQVDRVPGLCYVSTLFWHVQYLPLFPLRGYLVREGSEKDEQFQGVRIPLSLKSVLAGYLRGWLGAAAIFTGGVGALATTSFYVGVENGGIVAVLAAAAAMTAALWFILRTHTWWFLPVQLALLLGSAAVYHDVRTREPAAARVPNAGPGSPERRRHDASYIDSLLIANAAALLYTLTRFLTPVSYRRALELGRLLGIPPEQVTANLGLDPAPRTESPPKKESSI
jgi:hypothetical protein